MIIISFDPGISTGCAIKKEDKYFTCTLALEEAQGGKLRELITPCDQVVYENFVGYASHQMRVSAEGFETVKLIGRIQEICLQLNKPVFKYAAQNRLAWMKKAKELIKTKQTISINPTRHEPDALAHLLNHEYQLKQAAILEEIIAARKKA